MDAETSLGILVFLGIIKIAVDIWRNKLLMDNRTALQALKDEIANRVVPALQDLAKKVAAGQDVSQDMTDLATSLDAAVTTADPDLPPQPPAQS